MRDSNVLDLIFTQDHNNIISDTNIIAPVHKSDHSSITFSISNRPFHDLPHILISMV